MELTLKLLFTFAWLNVAVIATYNIFIGLGFGIVLFSLFTIWDNIDII